MPMRVESVAAAGEVHPSPFVGPINHTYGQKIDVSTLDTEEVDQYGYIKPGVPIQINSGAVAPVPGALVTAADQRAGVVVEAVKIAADNAPATLAAAADVEVAVAVFCMINRDIVEDSLGRVLSAFEVTALRAGNVEIIE